jgi:anti-anti-sigma factor
MSTDASKRAPLDAAEIVDFGRLSVTSKREGDVHTIGLIGELDLATAAEAEQQLTRAEAGATSIVLDLSALTFIDSTGIRMIVAADARARANSHCFRLLRGSPRVQRVFEISGIEKIVGFAD